MLKQSQHSWLIIFVFVLVTSNTLQCLHAAPAAPSQPQTPLQPHPEVAALLAKANTASQARKFEESLIVLHEALARSRSLNDKVGQVRTLNTIGNTYVEIGQPQKALKFYDDSLPLLRQGGDKKGEATIYNKIGMVTNTIGQPQLALKFYDHALALLRETGQDKTSEASIILNNMGVVYNKTGQPQKALELHDQALSLSRAMGDKVGEARTLTYAGMIYKDIGQQQKALECFNQSLGLNRQAGQSADKALEAGALANIGSVHQDIGQLQKALEFYNQAVPLLRGNKKSEATALNNIGLIYDDMGQPQKALEFYNLSLGLNRALQDKGGEAYSLINIGIVYDDIGQPQKALEFYSRALPLLAEIGDKRRQASTLRGMGILYDNLGQPLKALEFYNQALPLNRAVEDKVGETMTLNSIGVLFIDMGESHRALEVLSLALPLARETGAKKGEATILGNIGGAYNKIGQPQKALEFYNQALSLKRAVGDKQGEAVTLNNIGSIYHDMGQPQKALEFYNQSLVLKRAVEDKAGEATTLSNIAIAKMAMGHLSEANRDLHSALMILEGMRESLGGLSVAKVSFLESNLHTYHAYINLLLKQQNPADAFAWAEKTKARALLDLMHDGKVEISKGVSAQEQQRERELKQRMAQLNQQLVAEEVRPDADKARLQTLRQQSTQAEGELQKFSDSLYARHPDLARKRAAMTVASEEVVQFLPANTALLNYVALRTHSVDKTVLLCVTVENGKAIVKDYTIEKTREELMELADDFRDACADAGKNYRSKARELYTLLLAPAASQLSGKQHLIVCPDGPLWGLPFQALLVKGATTEPFLLEQYEISYAYSATAVQAAVLTKSASRRATPTGTLLALANPEFGGAERFGAGTLSTAGRPIRADARPIRADSRMMRGDGSIKPLPGTQVEADALKADFLDATIITGDRAQEIVAKQDAGKFRYVHFATHGYLNDAAPLMSSVVLAQPPKGSTEDGFLTAREIFDLNLTADMVVLSACDTGRGEKRRGEGVVGLTWALFVAGAPTQVVSQWAVNDESTAALMKGFYAHLKAGQGKSAALRTAALALMKDGQHGHPYYWAPFVLVGDWR